MFQLQSKNGKLFALKDGSFAGQIINDISGKCVENPRYCTDEIFAQIFSGHGEIYHLSENPINPFYSKPDDVFRNPECLPLGTMNVFIDQSQAAIDNYNAVFVG